MATQRDTLLSGSALLTTLAGMTPPPVVVYGSEAWWSMWMRDGEVTIPIPPPRWGGKRLSYDAESYLAQYRVSLPAVVDIDLAEIETRLAAYSSAMQEGSVAHTFDLPDWLSDAPPGRPWNRGRYRK